MRTVIIAEAGVNHNGDLTNAFKLVDAAAEAGVDYVKFQTFKAENLVSRHAKKAAYQIKNMPGSSDNSQFAMLKKLELSRDFHEELIRYCGRKKIQFLSTPFDIESMEYLAGIGLKLAKIPSGEITNLPYLRRAAVLFSEIILSTGMANMQEIKDAIGVLTGGGVQKANITVLHCNTEYPTPMQDVNLQAMLSIRGELGIKVGYSDHTLGIEVPVAAVALGASVIEKHFTLDKRMDGPDHAASLEPGELTAMVSAIRNIELALSGSGQKVPSASESKNINVARKSIIAIKGIRAGEIFTGENIGVKRPGNGISPMRWDELIGTVARRDFDEDELIDLK